jgi:hypothetical protein
MKSPSRSQNQLLSAAREYAERGWRVFPLWPRDKKPIPRNGFKEASTDRNQILEWWQSFPDANIGLATGEPFDVLDLDGPAGVPHLQELLGADFRHTGPVVLTGKGWHFYFQALGTGNRAGLLGGKVDYRGTGGYVVAPPSVHPSGRVYRWADDGRGPAAQLPVVPDLLAEVIAKPKSEVLQPAAVALSLPGGRTEIAATTRATTAAGRPDVVAVAQALGLTVHVKGVNYVTNCIFHSDPGPSMVLYTGQNKFYCYGCEAHGDSWDLQKREDITGRHAL